MTARLQEKWSSDISHHKSPSPWRGTGLNRKGDLLEGVAFCLDGSFAVTDGDRIAKLDRVAARAHPFDQMGVVAAKKVLAEIVQLGGPLDRDLLLMGKPVVPDGALSGIRYVLWRINAGLCWPLKECAGSCRCRGVVSA